MRASQQWFGLPDRIIFSYPGNISTKKFHQIRVNKEISSFLISLRVRSLKKFLHQIIIQNTSQISSVLNDPGYFITSGSVSGI